MGGTGCALERPAVVGAADRPGSARPHKDERLASVYQVGPSRLHLCWASVKSDDGRKGSCHQLRKS